MPAKQFRFFLLTIPFDDWKQPEQLADDLRCLRGQAECGRGTAEDESSGYKHWQIVAHFKSAVTLTRAKESFCPTAHIEPSRSSAANEYVFKDETYIHGTRFQLGKPALNRKSAKDWESIYEAAKEGKFDDIPKDVLIRSYSQLKRISVDNIKPEGIEKLVYVYWGETGAGKSRKAWELAPNAYPKDPRTKTWDGYQGEENVIIDEFRGGIDIGHILRWLDRYPVIVDVKYSATVLRCKTIYITSNLNPDYWYQNLDRESLDALRRRFTRVTHFTNLF